MAAGAYSQRSTGEVRGRRRGARGHRCRGLTLLEVLLSLALMILLLGGVFYFYSTVLAARDAGTQATREILLMRGLLQTMADEIRQATDIVPGDGEGFKGTQDRITIVRYGLPDGQAFAEFDPDMGRPPPAQLDFTRVTYELIWDQELTDENGDPVCHGMWRTFQRTFDPNPKFVLRDENSGGLGEDGRPLPETGMAGPPIDGELIAPEIKYLKFEYFDGAKWRDRWQVAYERAGGQTEGRAGDGGTGGKGSSGGGAGEAGGGDSSGLLGGDKDDAGGYALPQAVRITVGLRPVPPDDVKFDITRLDEAEARREYHPDRYTIVVYLQQADQSRLSSRKHGVDDDMAMGEITEGRQ